MEYSIFIDREVSYAIISAFRFAPLSARSSNLAAHSAAVNRLQIEEEETISNFDQLCRNILEACLLRLWPLQRSLCLVWL
jgi:hypothetical protein